MAKDSSSPAFPAEEHFTDGSKRWCSGMTLLDYFAGQALVGLTTLAREPGVSFGDLAADAYTLGRKMLEERDK